MNSEKDTQPGKLKALKIKLVFIKFVLVSWLVIALCFQNTIGLADNGDFSRSIGWISRGPIGMVENWPKTGTEDYEKRFFNYWIPYWKLNWNIPSEFTTSVVILWFPGVVANSILYSKDILYIPVVSLFPKLILCGLIFLLLRWIERQPKYQILLTLCLGIPIILLCTSTDYIVYFNSFYQETGSFLYFLLLVASIFFLWYRPSTVSFLSSLIIILLLATAKRGNFYWPLLAVPTIIYILYSKKIIDVKVTLILGFLLISIFIPISALLTKANDDKNLPYDSMFYGTLTFSDNPQMQLDQLGISGAMQCVNNSVFTVIGDECATKYYEYLSYLNSIRIINREPTIAFRMMKHVLDRMQDVSLDYLGIYSFDDPRSKISLRDWNGLNERFWQSANRTTPLNLWATVKYIFFPTGYVLGAVIILITFWFMFTIIKQLGDYCVLSIIGLISMLACVADMIVAILGDGRQELIKHLFMSNMYFDIAFIVFTTTVLLFSLKFIDKLGNIKNVFIEKFI